MKNNINPALQELKQFVGTWEMEISNASFFATLKPRGILVSYAILCAKYEQFCGDVVFGANRKPVVTQLLAKREESCFTAFGLAREPKNSEPRYGKISLKLSDC